jgi:hypothetical protein
MGVPIQGLQLPYMNLQRNKLLWQAVTRVLRTFWALASLQKPDLIFSCIRGAFR